MNLFNTLLLQGIIFEELALFYLLAGKLYRKLENFERRKTWELMRIGILKERNIQID